MLPPAVVLNVDAARVDESEEERLAGELPPAQYVADGTAGERDPLQPGAGQEPAPAAALLLKRPVRRLVGEEVDVLQARRQVLEAGRWCGVKVIHGLALCLRGLSAAVRWCPSAVLPRALAILRCPRVCPAVRCVRVNGR